MGSPGIGGNHPSDNRDDGRKCCGSSYISASNQARLALPQAPQTTRATLFSGVASNQNCLEIRGSGRRNKDRFNSHCREQSGVGFSSMGPLPRRPWSAFQARKVLKEDSLTIVSIVRNVDTVVEFPIIGKDAAVASSHCLVISLEENYNIINLH